MLIYQTSFLLKIKEKMFPDPDFYGTVRYAPKFGHKIEKAKMETKILKEKILKKSFKEFLKFERENFKEKF
jgi:hypothetical protein